MEPDKLSVVIKSTGSWSQKLYQELSSAESFEISTEGSNGPTSHNFLMHESTVLVSGGRAITPFISIVRESIFQSMKQCRSVRLKEQLPRPTDSPISAALGPNSWLWLFIIISSSLVMFLILLGIVTRYYVCLIDHNINSIHHFSYWAVWDMLLACACILLIGGAVFYPKQT
ncbi:hypothetical protein RJ641_033833 [Dillenia turbinata]|uniref:Uncharacterized protein n=1 Tax=Dillenia turbinata TaxID=194707 RepID=A0AAN8VKK1_9MAGN